MSVNNPSPLPTDIAAQLNTIANQLTSIVQQLASITSGTPLRIRTVRTQSDMMAENAKPVIPPSFRNGNVTD